MTAKTITSPAEITDETATEVDPFAELEEAAVVFDRKATGVDLSKISPRVKNDYAKSLMGYKPKTDSAGTEIPGATGIKLLLTQKFPTSAMLVEYTRQLVALSAHDGTSLRKSFWIANGDETAVRTTDIEKANVIRFSVAPKGTK